VSDGELVIDGMVSRYARSHINIRHVDVQGRLDLYVLFSQEGKRYAQVRRY
jgi:hypothetical protein